ncbi:hypothetical protein GLOIN_2v1764966 [Rhizophagus irregularis DAOM 181602=DAOM 197198]|uniref:Uncharacterized protein n=1 Tax=Rhizophagus irregularis (strain DAOM 181602 / DAOM 197198 / MUCL 43194) TaxID=747089 RepID=A0A2P4QQU0_RHIID|nr:hypothetical protein GLOIN_2v1764966 [Rhizophagus irregularis DAOM 181602=DAOM 197198]POG79928.1 hypothetical protein GLOIN_2v1764966 [Rhizophagus irregularis DAOM 181602=DAOM 197198]|eukprot:XP_025186794.1 hypothetical protein GLOIN_2v1764966 [Rhizophagus irregularis DAOM 181602=DAOM 197198]
MSGHSDHSSSSDDAISENNEYDKKCRKLDYLIDSADDGSGGETDESYSVMVYFKVEPFTGVTTDWNDMRSLYLIAGIQSCIDKVRLVRFGDHLECGVGHLIGVEPITYGFEASWNLMKLEITDEHDKRQSVKI